MGLHGLFLIDKPPGVTSHDVVARARRILKTKSVGHSGTLDPLASGLMVLLVGEATKLSQYILERNKAYQVRAQLGLTTDTLDTSGQILSRSSSVPSEGFVREAALSLQGEIVLPVPIYSAAKVAGKKLYEYAREGQEIQVPSKTMTFFDLKIEDQGPDWIEVFIRCTKGSFIRSWVHELGLALQSGAAMSQLRRTESSPYHLDQAISLEELEAQSESEGQKRGFVPMSAALPEARVLRVKGQGRVMIRNGLISHDLRTQLISCFRPGKDDLVKIMDHEQNELLALIGLEEGKGFVIRRVFRYE